MEFSGFLVLNDWTFIVIIPTVVVNTEDPRYRGKCIHISLHWLGWHCRWSWIERT